MVPTNLIMPYHLKLKDSHAIHLGIQEAQLRTLVGRVQVMLSHNHCLAQMIAKGCERMLRGTCK